MSVFYVSVLIRMHQRLPVCGLTSICQFQAFWDGPAHTLPNLHRRQLERDYESMHTLIHAYTQAQIFPAQDKNSVFF